MNPLHRFFRFAIGVALILFGQSSRDAIAAEKNPPNILFILCDDHRFDCFGAAGHPFLETPHMDQMVRDGAMMTHACHDITLFTQSSINLDRPLCPQSSRGRQLPSGKSRSCFLSTALTKIRLRNSIHRQVAHGW